MKIGNWYLGYEEYASITRGKVEFENGDAHISLCGKYSTATICCVVEEFNNTAYMKINSDIPAINASLDKVMRWYDKDNNLLLCDFMDKDIIKPMKNSAKLEVTYTFYGSEESFIIKPFSVTEGNKIEERMAIVAAGAIDYGTCETHKLRKCEDNLRQSLELIDKACEGEKPDIIVLTETFYSRNISGEPLSKKFLKLNSPEIGLLKDKAKEKGIYLAFSIHETEDNISYNSCVVIDRNGDIAADYHKTHLTRGEVAMGLKKGDEAVVIDADFGKCGIAICWDLFFPEYVSTLVKKGAEIIINPTAGYHKDMHTVRAKDNGVYIVTAGAQPVEAVVINPDGKIIAGESEEGIAKAKIDLNERFPVFPAYSERRSVYLNEMRNELYRY